jgi:uncharacterized protein YjbI with pentapeptide repeats
MNDDAERRAAVQESARRFSPLLMSFLITGSFLAITALTTDHEMLLRGRSVRLPLIDASVPIEFFFLLAPFLWLLQHAALLMHLMLVMRRVRDLGPGQIKPQLKPALPVSAAGELILREERPDLMNAAIVLLFYVAFCAFPLAVLCLLQGQFVAYHSGLTTGVQTVMILLDLCLIWVTVPRILGGPGRRHWTWWPGWRVWRWRGRSLRRLLSLSVLAFVAYFTLWLAFITIDCDAIRARRLWPKLFLEVRGRGLRGSTKEQGLVLNDRDLRCADLRGTDLSDADLGGSNLTDALLDGADLSGAAFSPRTVARAKRSSAKETANLRNASLVDARLSGANLTGVSMQGATLVRAKLEGARLDDALLQGADLTSAVLTNASLIGAPMQGANLVNASLTGARLDRARLDRAILDGADLQGADLSYVRARGLRAVGGDATCADFRGADLAGSSFINVRLDGVDFSGADVAGADFRYSKLRRTFGLNPVANDFRWAELEGSCLGKREIQEERVVALARRDESPVGSDFRDAVPGELTDEAQDEIEEASQVAQPDRRNRCTKLIDGQWPEGAVCLGPGSGELDLGPVASPTRIAQYYDRLREFLAERICQQTGLGEGLLARFLRAGDLSNPEVGKAAALALLMSQQKDQEECAAFRRLTRREIRTLQVVAGCLRAVLADPLPVCDLRLSDAADEP